VSGIFDPYHRWLGIPPKDQPANHYRLLAIEVFEADPEVIRDAAEQRIAHVRTYQLGQYSELSQRILNELATAKACLLNPATKAAYDESLRARQGGATGAASSPAAKPAGKPPAAPPPSDRPAAKSAVATPRPPRPAPTPSRPAKPAAPAAPTTPPPMEETADEYALQWPVPVAAAPTQTPLGSQSPVLHSRWSESPKSRRKSKQWPPRAIVAAAGAAVVLVVTIVGIVVLGGRARGPVAASQVDKPVAVRQELPKPNEVAAASPAASGNVPEVKPIATYRDPPKQEPKKFTPTPRPKAKKPAAGTPPRAPKRREDDPPPVPGRNPGPTSLPTTLHFPSGAELTEAKLGIPRNWQDTMFPKSVVVYVAKYPSDATKGVYGLKAAKLDGGAATLYEAGHLQTLAVYAKGRLNGPLKTWDEVGRRVLYAEYTAGRRDGLLCFFRDGAPWLVQEWDGDQARNEYLVQWQDAGPRIVPRAKMTKAEHEERIDAMEKLAALQAAMGRTESQLKRDLAEWFRKQDHEAKQKKFVAGAGDRRDRERQRSAERAVKAEASARAWRESLRRAGVPGI
jgi:hypothetical protein